MQPVIRRRGERGQTTAFIMSMMFVMVLFVGMVCNVGQAVNRKIALQTIADAGAYTGASRMAEGMNYLAFTSGAVQEMWSALTWAWAAVIVTGEDCDTFQTVHDVYQTAYQVFNIAFQALNLAYQPWPWKDAKRVAEYNARDLFPTEFDRIQYRSADYSLETGFILPKRDLLFLVNTKEVPDGTSPQSQIPAMPFNSLPPLGPGSMKSHGNFCLKTVPIIGKIPWWWSGNFGVWWQKESENDAKYFVFIAKAPKAKAIMFDWFFGPNAMPEMKAAAAARPIGGSIKDGSAKYVAQMVPMKKVMTVPGGVIIDNNLNGLLGPVRLVNH